MPSAIRSRSRPLLSGRSRIPCCAHRGTSRCRRPTASTGSRLCKPVRCTLYSDPAGSLHRTEQSLLALGPYRCRNQLSYRARSPRKNQASPFGIPPSFVSATRRTVSGLRSCVQSEDPKRDRRCSARTNLICDLRLRSCILPNSGNLILPPLTERAYFFLAVKVTRRFSRTAR